jgi:hypothetical protein
MEIRNFVIKILSDKKARHTGLHVKHIALHIYCMNNNLFSNGENPTLETLKEKVNRILLYDVRKKKGSTFSRVINPKTKKYRKGVYKLKK